MERGRERGEGEEKVRERGKRQRGEGRGRWRGSRVKGGKANIESEMCLNTGPSERFI